MAWREINTSTETTAALLRAALVTDGLAVTISKETGSSIVAHNGASPLKQLETVTVVEFRGLTQAAAEMLVGLASDGSTTTVYYAKRASAGTASLYMAAGVRTGNVVNVQASRYDESGQWVVRESTTSYSADGTGWSTTRPTGASTTGVEISKTKSSIITQYETNVKKQTVTTTITEYSFLTKAEADDLCVSSENRSVTRTSYSATRQVYVNGTATQQTYTGYYCYITGNVKSSVMRYVDEINGWTVTQTYEVYSA